MVGTLFDTNILIDHLRGCLKAVECGVVIQAVHVDSQESRPYGQDREEDETLSERSDR